MSDTFGAGWFVTSTGTDTGKTVVSRALTAGLVARGQAVSSIKPAETGCTPDPPDASALARACGRPELIHAPGLYRVAPALAPDAAARALGTPALDLQSLVDATTALYRAGDVTLIEGAGGLLVPLSPTATMADLAAALGLPLLLVAANQLGVLSHTLTAYECARARDLPVAAVILNQPAAQREDSARSNGDILAERIDAPVLHFPYCAADDDATLARAVPDAWWPILLPA